MEESARVYHCRQLNNGPLGDLTSQWTAGQLICSSLQQHLLVTYPDHLFQGFSPSNYSRKIVTFCWPACTDLPEDSHLRHSAVQMTVVMLCTTGNSNSNPSHSPEQQRHRQPLSTQRTH